MALAGTGSRKQAKRGKKNRKHGRNAAYCKVYRLSRIREKNKARRLKKHLARFPDDACASSALQRCAA